MIFARDRLSISQNDDLSRGRGVSNIELACTTLIWTFRIRTTNNFFCIAALTAELCVSAAKKNLTKPNQPPIADEKMTSVSRWSEKIRLRGLSPVRVSSRKNQAFSLGEISILSNTVVPLKRHEETSEVRPTELLSEHADFMVPRCY